MRVFEMKASLLSVAVLGALAAMFAAPVMAADPTEDEVAVIRRPTNFVEIGAENTGRSSAKFGEYNGLKKAGGDAIVNFSLKGGDAYQGGDGVTRWSVSGTDLGTTSREATVSVSQQGKWSLGVGYDELRHNISDTYQTPYQGSAGGNVFTLPSVFTGANAASTKALSSGQLGAFSNVDIGSTRKNTSLTAGVNLTPQWDLKLEYNHLEQFGAKLMAFAADTRSGAAKGAAESVSILPNPTNYKTDTVNLALNWAGEKNHLTASYFGSYFRDGFSQVDWQTYQVATGKTAGVNMNTMTTAPGNDFHQFSLMGGYFLAAKTKLAGGISYSRNTQNDAFVDSMQNAPATLGATAGFGNLPATSLNGVVVSTHADLKLTDQSIKDLSLSAGLKYDKRDNQTPSNIYSFYSFSGNQALYPNAPLSTKKLQVELAADYKIDKAQNVRVAFNHDDTSRWCGQYAVLANTGTTTITGFPAGTNCVVATGAKEDKLATTYRFKASEDLNLSAGYSYAKRKSDFDIYARPPIISTNGSIFNAAGVVVGSLIKGQNASDYIGFHPYLDEDRKEQILKGSVNWQANEKLALGVTARYTDDVYDTTYGWKDGNQWSLNLDASYAVSDTESLSGYVTQQSRKRNRTDLRNIPGVTSTSATTLTTVLYGTDSGTLKDTDTTIGLAFKKAGLMGGKLELVGDLSYSLGKTDYGTTLNWAGTSSTGATCSAPTILACGDLPTVKNTLTQFKLTGTYNVDKASKIAVGYLFQQLKSDDYFYNTAQYGYTPSTVLPTNQQSGSYTVNVISASYIYSFK